MTAAKEATPIQKKALASLGRNVLHFQRLEAQLKILVLLCDFQSPLSQLAATHKKSVSRLQKKTMGTVIAELHERLYGVPAAPAQLTNLTEACITFQFRVNADPQYLLQQKRNLGDLVLERNALIHQDLATFDPSSDASCRQLITHLDKQNERILIQLKAVQRMVDSCKEGFQKAIAALASKASS